MRGLALHDRKHCEGGRRRYQGRVDYVKDAAELGRHRRTVFEADRTLEKAFAQVAELPGQTDDHAEERRLPYGDTNATEMSDQDTYAGRNRQTADQAFPRLAR